MSSLNLEQCADPVVYQGTVPSKWIDVNGHMNVACYLRVFDNAIDELWIGLGLSDERRERTGSSTFAVASNILYIRELLEGQNFVVTSRLLAWDDKRLHQIQRIFDTHGGWLAATCEWLHLHVDLRDRKVSPWPEDVMRRFAAHPSAKVPLPWPEDAGRVISIAAPNGPRYTPTEGPGRTSAL